ncbi:MAG TPA: hypothetical protein VLL05_03030 [Terriglobales bacterium]|nr:hypothetical protein [Terriglobales bacterium]
MTGTWLTVKLLVLSTWVVLLAIVLILAFSRLKGRLGNRGLVVAMLVGSLFPHAVREVFENDTATRVAYVISAVVAVGATIALIKLLARREGESFAES